MAFYPYYHFLGNRTVIMDFIGNSRKNWLHLNFPFKLLSVFWYIEWYFMCHIYLYRTAIPYGGNYRKRNLKSIGGTVSVFIGNKNRSFSNTFLSLLRSKYDAWWWNRKLWILLSNLFFCFTRLIYKSSMCLYMRVCLLEMKSTWSFLFIIEPNFIRSFFCSAKWLMYLHKYLHAL